MGRQARGNQTSDSQRRELFSGWVTALLFPDPEQLGELSLRNSTAVSMSSKEHLV